ncbi:N-acetylmuramoyl-L-alanine amidase [Staphylococcus saprophyticus]|uniref:N-acetylmuramoyl-L-alanine amidase n=1 Tax=Staphylococcus saprophyticus TaxID=29385 RepID=UPI0012AE39E1|nr:N-acetylmuramoyl-L-alanine amidase [Staphylococcus saprophyticus]MDW4153319.1 N-acetylmuramoyl-L-alanine amidase [Staphylococcus saprophyticus]MDW4184268.1 N-acetylmuramoyl-L-alanine amidase [Staphylococcus saprophyticus]MDW4352811.1 N-acetylmuramoyl-L-alanine amidase [Staphylococcus saprophyticus]MDW4460829.1 N-acetylmuramoyl-L-alanine amidase [Staphylococcus saprophyticus]MDW4468267.1 N-acetylmuramoyl-L-alanine amidase [Staphylococcus saprophyticus]
MTVNKTKEQAITYMKSLKGKGWDFDGAFGWQCFDLSNMQWNYLTGGRLAGYYAKDIPFENNFDGLATVYKNTPSFLPEEGDIFVMDEKYGQGAGHTGMVWSANLNTFVGIEQNWYGGGRYKTEVAQLVTHTYDMNMHFIRPHYKAKVSTVSKVKAAVTKPKVSKATGKKILIVSGHGYNDPGAENKEMKLNERDFIRKYIAPNVQKYLKQAGHTVDLYGGSKQDQNLYTDTAYGERIGNHKDYGMYWVHKQKYDIVVELHLDAAGASASGGHVIISNQWPADKVDKDINNCLKATVGTIRGIDPRNDLLNANVAGRLGTNYRLVEMGFITNKKDMNYLKKNYDKFSKELAGAINGKPIGGTSAGSKQITWKWKGRFTANTTIKVRRKPGLSGAVVDKGSWIYKNQWVDFVSVTKKDNYWWVKFKYPTNPKAGYFYMAICKITDKKERLKKEKKLFGKIKYK